MTLRPLNRRGLGYCFLPLFVLSGSLSFAQAKQDKDLPALIPTDFTLPASPVIDSNSSAVILANFGDIHFVGNEHDWFSYVIRIHERIKILNKKAFDAATVQVGLYNPIENPEKIDRITASTYNLENGQMTEIRLDKKDIFEDRPNKEYKLVKWTMPGVREGSIIDYSYTITSDYLADLPTWRFQSNRFPCLMSELQVSIPETLFYTLIKQGIHPYAVDKGNEGSDSYRIGRKDGSWVVVSANTMRHQWVMKDIPAFEEEPFLANDNNYLDKLDFQLAKTYNGDELEDYYNSWKKATDQLLARADFGEPLDENGQTFKDLIQTAIGNSDGYAAQARALYYYVAGHFTCDDYDDKYIRTSLNDVVRRHGGSVGDINLLLVCLMRNLGLTADPVLLSTREFGFNLASYPVLPRFNYVIARVVINGNIVYLDAAHPKLGFGQLDANCYNGHARIISKTDSGSVYFDPDSLREKTATVVFISQTDKGPAGTWTSTLSPQQSYELREEIGEKGQDAYFKNIQTGLGEDVQVSDGGIDSLDRPERPVTVHYSFSLRSDSGESKIYLNPFFDAGVHENPFKAAERKYPVEMPYTGDDLYVFTMQIPDGYSVEELPKSTRASLNGAEGSFEYLAGADNGMVQIRCHLRLNKANFPPDDYSTLRDFYALIVKKEAEAIVLKKN